MTHATTKDEKRWLSTDPMIRKALLLGLAGILVWRGVWLLTDLFLTPDNLPLSAVLSIVLGLGIMIFYSEVRL